MESSVYYQKRKVSEHRRQNKVHRNSKVKGNRAGSYTENHTSSLVRILTMLQAKTQMSSDTNIEERSHMDLYLEVCGALDEGLDEWLRAKLEVVTHVENEA